MKTSTILLSLLLFNSTVLVGQLTTFLFGNVSPFVIAGSEIFLGLFYYF